VMKATIGAKRTGNRCLDCLGDARMSSQAMIVMGVKDVQSDVLIVGDIAQSLVEKEVTIL